MLVRVLRLRTHNPGSTSLIETRTSEANARGQQARREQIWVPLDRISPNLQRAILAGEDTNFLTHRGFDYEAIQKVWDQAQREAAREAKAEGDEEGDWLPSLPDFKRGASTVTQQLAKNLYLSSQRTFVRKGQEAVLTVFLERLLTKRRILEIYLNVIEWGDGIYGAEAAARRYFNKSAASLVNQRSGLSLGDGSQSADGFQSANKPTSRCAPATNHNARHAVSEDPLAEEQECRNDVRSRRAEFRNAEATESKRAERIQPQIYADNTDSSARLTGQCLLGSASCISLPLLLPTASSAPASTPQSVCLRLLSLATPRTAVYSCHMPHSNKKAALRRGGPLRFDAGFKI